MRPELLRLQAIEQHLLGSPSPAEARRWELHTLLDPDLAADAAAQQQLYAALRRAGRRQLRAELAAIHRQLYQAGWRGWLRQALASGQERLHKLLSRLPTPPARPRRA